MALRTKTIEYAFVLSAASVATATLRTYTALTVNIPETTSRTCRSVIVDFSPLGVGVFVSRCVMAGQRALHDDVVRGAT